MDLEKDPKDQIRLEDEVGNSSSSDAAVAGKVESVVRLLRVGGNTPLVDAQIVTNPESLELPKEDKPLTYDGYTLPPQLIGRGITSLIDWVRYSVARRKSQLLKKAA